MKIRNGFVSNSSSSSFIIQGIKISNEIYDGLEPSKIYSNKLKTEANRYYFSDEEPDGHIIGVSLGYLEDGVIDEITPIDKKEIIERLEKIGINATEEEIKIYAQFISNDNY
jgi:hypothetical protein